MNLWNRLALIIYEITIRRRDLLSNYRTSASSPRVAFRWKHVHCNKEETCSQELSRRCAAGSQLPASPQLLLDPAREGNHPRGVWNVGDRSTLRCAPWQPTPFYGLWFLTRSGTVLGEIESSLYRNKSQKDMEVSLKPLFEKYMPLNSNTAHGARGAQVDYERQKDHYSHFILRLAFCRS